MRYEMTEDEERFVQGRIDELVRSGGHADFTGTTISPDNLRTAMRRNGFDELYLDSNAMDNWCRFERADVGVFTMFFNAESFDLILEKG